MISAQGALTYLQQGNARFAAAAPNRDAISSEARRIKLLESQAPFAAILGCSDSRVPVEIVFDQDVGDLFVIRVAGNIVAPSLVGSVEFAAERFGTQLVVVMGHSRCGAVQATLEQLQRPATGQSPNLRSIVDRIRPSVQELLTTHPGDSEELLKQAVRANIIASVHQLRHGSAVLEQLQEQGLLVVGAEYALETGIVDFFEVSPEDARASA